MTYFKIGDTDFSMYVNKLTVATDHKYTARTTRDGNTMVKYINTKRLFEVGIIPLDSEAMSALMAAIKQFNVSISFLNPETNELEENVNCIIPNNLVEYYTVQAGNVKFKAFSLDIMEL